MAKISTPPELFTHKLGAALTMEQTMLRRLQTLEQTANDPELSVLGKQAETQPCPTIDGLKEEASR